MQTIKNFMQRCKKERDFTLPSVHSYFVTKPLNLNSVESVIHNKCVIFQVLLLPSNILLNFCLRLKLYSKKFLVVITKLRFIFILIFCMSSLTINTSLNFRRVMNWWSLITYFFYEKILSILNTNKSISSNFHQNK